MRRSSSCVSEIFFSFTDTATSQIYTLSLHDALPISGDHDRSAIGPRQTEDQDRPHPVRRPGERSPRRDRKSTRLNSSHSQISYAVFCLKKKTKREKTDRHSR